MLPKRSEAPEGRFNGSKTPADSRAAPWLEEKEDEEEDDPPCLNEVCCWLWKLFPAANPAPTDDAPPAILPPADWLEKDEPNPDCWLAADEPLFCPAKTTEAPAIFPLELCWLENLDADELC